VSWVARRQPHNPVGWILLASTSSLGLLLDARLYAVLDYRLDNGRLPLGPVAVWLAGSIAEILFLLLPLAILLFPDGRLPQRWRRVMRVYLALVVLYQVTAFAGEAASIAGHHIQVDVKGQFITPEHLTGIADRKTLIYAVLAGSLAIAYLAGIYLTDCAVQAITGQSSALAVTLSASTVGRERFASTPYRRRTARTPGTIQI
jgi:hypothetical protein